MWAYASAICISDARNISPCITHPSDERREIPYNELIDELENLSRLLARNTVRKSVKMPILWVDLRIQDMPKRETAERTNQYTHPSRESKSRLILGTPSSVFSTRRKHLLQFIDHRLYGRHVIVHTLAELRQFDLAREHFHELRCLEHIRQRLALVAGEAIQ